MSNFKVGDKVTYIKHDCIQIGVKTFSDDHYFNIGSVYTITKMMSTFNGEIDLIYLDGINFHVWDYQIEPYNPTGKILQDIIDE